jgi:NAD(P)-dependent dehydrogenase (short-subunit alcohol dehydrogenase family)
MSESWTADQMPDCSEKTVLITGANSGLGFEATKAFAKKGATVIMACRSTERGEQAAQEIAQQLPGGTGATLNVRQCDLASLESIEAFAEEVREAYDDLHILCNNAGVMAIPRSETEDDFEKQLGVNHLGHFALTGQLLDMLVVHILTRLVRIRDNIAQTNFVVAGNVGDSFAGSWRYGISLSRGLLRSRLCCFFGRNLLGFFSGVASARNESTEAAAESWF